MFVGANCSDLLPGSLHGLVFRIVTAHSDGDSVRMCHLTPPPLLHPLDLVCARSGRPPPVHRHVAKRLVDHKVIFDPTSATLLDFEA